MYIATIGISMMIGISITNGSVGGLRETHPAKPLYERAQKEIYALNLDTAHGSLSEINEKYPDSPYEDKVTILKNMISLAQTFSNLRLYSAYQRGSSLSPSKLLEPYRSVYFKRVKEWKKRLEADRKESSAISEEVELSLKFAGTEALSYFVRAGIDSIENLKKGIPPTPSQAQNIEEFESYAALLSVVYLCMQKNFQMPHKTIVLRGKVAPNLLVYYSNLWLKRDPTKTCQNAPLFRAGSFTMSDNLQSSFSTVLRPCGD